MSPFGDREIPSYVIRYPTISFKGVYTGKVFLTWRYVVIPVVERSNTSSIYFQRVEVPLDTFTGQDCRGCMITSDEVVQ